jgi:hypothetical protein
MIFPHCRMKICTDKPLPPAPQKIRIHIPTAIYSQLLLPGRPSNLPCLPGQPGSLGQPSWVAWSTKLGRLVNQVGLLGQPSWVAWSTKLGRLVNQVGSLGQPSKVTRSTKLGRLVNQVRSLGQPGKAGKICEICEKTFSIFNFQFSIHPKNLRETSAPRLTDCRESPAIFQRRYTIRSSSE